MTAEMATFENMPHMLANLTDMVKELCGKVECLTRPEVAENGTQWFNVEELCAYLPSHPRKQTIYSWTSTRRIPFHKKGRSIMFDKAEIDEWLKNNEYMKSVDEIEQEAKSFVYKK